MTVTCYGNSRTNTLRRLCNWWRGFWRPIRRIAEEQLILLRAGQKCLHPAGIKEKQVLHRVGRKYQRIQSLLKVLLRLRCLSTVKAGAMLRYRRMVAQIASVGYELFGSSALAR